MENLEGLLFKCPNEQMTATLRKLSQHFGLTLLLREALNCNLTSVILENDPSSV